VGQQVARGGQAHAGEVDGVRPSAGRAAAVHEQRPVEDAADRVGVRDGVGRDRQIGVTVGAHRALALPLQALGVLLGVRRGERVVLGLGPAGADLLAREQPREDLGVVDLHQQRSRRARVRARRRRR